MIQDCLQVMKSGDVEALFEIIPRIGVLRDRKFHKPLLEILAQSKDLKRREFAAYAMGAMGERAFLDALWKVFQASVKEKGARAEGLLVAAIEAIGAIGDDAAAELFLPVLQVGKGSRQVVKRQKRIAESLGAVAQQGGARCMEALLNLTRHQNPELRALSVSEISVAFWHRPNEIGDHILGRMRELTADRSRLVAESALSALQNLADLGCRRAERSLSEFWDR